MHAKYRLTRRHMTHGLLALGGAVVTGCSAEALSGSGAASGAGSGDGPKGPAQGGDRGASGGGADSGWVDGGGAQRDASADAGGEKPSDAAVDAGKPAPPTGWASGGTKSMVDAGSYPNPFPVAPAACLVFGAKTEGPCTEAADQVRKDISEGYTGIPMRLALRLSASDCKPIAGAKVKIWHTQIAGSYSGNTPNNGMCLKDQADAKKHYFRGVQTSDSTGVVAFDSCFPGWYPGRTIHIHVTVTLNGKAFTSQLVFEQTLVDDIFDTHAEYKGFGRPDTSNAKDGEVSGKDLATYVLKTVRMQDGAMLASKDVIVRL
jgi:protocatechuate 3,4-dioxygenase beta subunit